MDGLEALQLRGKPERSGRYFALAHRPHRIEAEPAGKAGNRPLRRPCGDPHPGQKEGQAARSSHSVSAAVSDLGDR